MSPVYTPGPVYGYGYGDSDSESAELAADHIQAVCTEDFHALQERIIKIIARTPNISVSISSRRRPFTSLAQA